MLTVKDIREQFKALYGSSMFNASGLLEIVGASFIADEESIFGKVDYAYVDKEIAWYNSKSRNVYDMHNPPKIWKEVATPDGRINSNYGWCIYSDDNFNQYYKVLHTLQKNPNSRQGTMIYTRPSMHEDSCEDGMKDFMCTNAVTYFIRDCPISKVPQLHCVVQMRSNDAVYGYKNDYAWQKYVLTKLGAALGVGLGDIHWQVASLHIYPRHFNLLEDLQ